MYVRIAKLFILQDSPERIDFHIRNDDYFAFLATLMGFFEEAIGRCDCMHLQERERDLARELRHDLRYVQANYHIKPRHLGDVQTIPKRGNLARRP